MAGKKKKTRKTITPGKTQFILGKVIPQTNTRGSTMSSPFSPKTGLDIEKGVLKSMIKGGKEGRIARKTIGLFAKDTALAATRVKKAKKKKGRIGGR